MCYRNRFRPHFGLTINNNKMCAQARRTKLLRANATTTSTASHYWESFQSRRDEILQPNSFIKYNRSHDIIAKCEAPTNRTYSAVPSFSVGFQTLICSDVTRSEACIRWLCVPLLSREIQFSSNFFRHLFTVWVVSADAVCLISISIVSAAS